MKFFRTAKTTKELLDLKKLKINISTGSSLQGSWFIHTLINLFTVMINCICSDCPDVLMLKQASSTFSGIAVTWSSIMGRKLL